MELKVVSNSLTFEKGNEREEKMTLKFVEG